MKRIYFLLFSISLFLFSCNDDDTVEIKTSLPVTISVEVTEPSAISQKSGQSEFSFTASETYYLKDNEDVKDYLDNMKYIAHKGHSVEIIGLKDGETINNIEISITGGNVLMAFENVTKFDYGTEVPQPLVGYAHIGEVLLYEKQITVTVTGNTNKAPMDFDVNVTLQIAAHVNEM